MKLLRNFMRNLGNNQVNMNIYVIGDLCFGADIDTRGLAYCVLRSVKAAQAVVEQLI